MWLLGELHLKHSFMDFMDSRRLRDALWDEHGEKVNLKKVPKSPYRVSSGGRLNLSSRYDRWPSRRVWAERFRQMVVA